MEKTDKDLKNMIQPIPSLFLFHSLPLPLSPFPNVLTCVRCCSIKCHCSFIHSFIHSFLIRHDNTKFPANLLHQGAGSFFPDIFGDGRRCGSEFLCFGDFVFRVLWFRIGLGGENDSSRRFGEEAQAECGALSR